MWRGVFRRRAIFFLRTKRVEAISFWTEIWLHVIGHIEFASGLDASGRHPCDSTVYKRMYIQRYCTTSFVIFVNGMNARTNRKRNDAHRASNNTITGQNYYFFFFFEICMEF